MLQKRTIRIRSAGSFDLDILKARFQKRYQKKESGCWEWKGLKKPYGKFTIFGRIDRAHRASYMLFVGKIDGNKVVRHTCDNAGCVNPEHLLLGTQNDNIQDQISRRRNTRGSMSHHAKITPREAVAIRALWSTGKLKQREIAQAYGLHQQTIGKIVNRIKWKEII